MTHFAGNRPKDLARRPVWLTTPQATTSLAGTIPVYSHDEHGLQGIAVDPDFATNRWVYVHYAPPLSTPGGDAPAPPPGRPPSTPTRATTSSPA